MTELNWDQLLTSPAMLNMMKENLTGEKAPKVNLANLKKSQLKMRQFLSNDRSAGRVSIPIFTRTSESNPYSSDKSIDSLSQTAIENLKINIPGKGFYLLLRTIDEPHSVNGITTIVEDHKGDVMLFTAYNLVSPELAKHPARVLPLGTIFILKEPFLKTGLSGDFLLRTDSPSDVIILTDNHRLFEMTKNIKWKNKITLERSRKICTAEDLKKRGNDFFLKKDYLSALNCYLSAAKLLTSTDDQLKLFLYLNISATYLILEYFELSQEYALKALDMDPKNLKGLYRAGRAYYELRQFEMSKNYFEKLVSVQSNHSEGTRELKKTLKRLKEMSGKVNIAELHDTCKQIPQALIDCADFVGPLKIVSSCDKRQAVHATEDIKPGTLIAASKALVCTFTDVDLPVYVNSDQSIIPGGIGKAVQEACQLIYKNPKTFGSALYEMAINDAFLDVIKPKPFCDDACREPHVDVGRIRKILIRNGIAVGNNYRPVGLVSGQPSSCALFHFPSFINHCCLANASWTTYNNVMVVHAIKHIKAGEEITISYIDPLTRYSLKEREFNKRELICDCFFCKSNLSVPAPLRVQIENKILEVEKSVEMAAKGMMIFSDVYLTKMKKDVDKIEKLIKSTGFKEIEYYLAIPYYSLSVAYARVDQFKDARRTLWKAISALGFDTRCIDSWSKGQVDFPLSKETLFSYIFLSFIEFLISYSNQLGLETEASKYMRALEVGHALYRGATKQMVIETIQQSDFGQM